MFRIFVRQYLKYKHQNHRRHTPSTDSLLHTFPHRPPPPFSFLSNLDVIRAINKNSHSLDYFFLEEMNMDRIFFRAYSSAFFVAILTAPSTLLCI